LPFLAIALPCDSCSQYLAELRTTQEFLAPTRTIIDEWPLHNDLHAQEHPLVRREIDFNLTQLIKDDWRDRVWALSKTFDWNPEVYKDYIDVVKVHFPQEYDGCMVPERPYWRAVWSLPTPSTPAE
jgi:hypothetical protein